jgi:hypothetical protein
MGNNKLIPNVGCRRVCFERIITWLSRAPPLLLASASKIQFEAQIQKNIYIFPSFKSSAGKNTTPKNKKKNLWRH